MTSALPRRASARSRRPRGRRSSSSAPDGVHRGLADEPVGFVCSAGGLVATPPGQDSPPAPRPSGSRTPASRAGCAKLQRRPEAVAQLDGHERVEPELVERLLGIWPGVRASTRATCSSRTSSTSIARRRRRGASSRAWRACRRGGPLVGAAAAHRHQLRQRRRWRAVVSRLEEHGPAHRERPRRARAAATSRVERLETLDRH